MPPSGLLLKRVISFFPELDFNKTGYTLKLDSSLKVINGQLAYLVTVTGPEGISVKYFYDQKTGLKLKQYTRCAKQHQARIQRLPRH